MAFSISHTFLFPATARKLMSNLFHIPVFIAFLLEKFYPHIGYSHGQSEIEANTTFLVRATESGKA
jgi:hypothetical protein